MAVYMYMEFDYGGQIEPQKWVMGKWGCLSVSSQLRGQVDAICENVHASLTNAVFADDTTPRVTTRKFSLNTCS